MKKSEITFYSFALSPFALKVQSYLLYKRVTFKTVYVDPIAMRKEIPCGTTIPVLTINDESRNESTAIGLWLDELYPDDDPLLPINGEQVLSADQWVTDVLIATAFRISLGVNDPFGTQMKKRWQLSDALNKTIPNKVSILFRIAHLLFVHRAGFLQQAINSTDLSQTNEQWCESVAQEFTALLAGGPFLCGSLRPTLADLSAFPQIVVPQLRGESKLLLPGSEVAAWVGRMQKAMPDYHSLLAKPLRI